MMTDFFHSILSFLSSIPAYMQKDTKEFLYDWMGGNDVIFFGINSIRDPQYDALMRSISWLGNHEHFPYYLGALAAWVLVRLLLKITTKKAIKNYLVGWMGIFMVLTAGYAANGVVITKLKDHFSYPRPYVALASAGQVYKMEATASKDNFRSFPSGHVSFIILMVIGLWPVIPKKIAALAVLLIPLMAWSRVSLGVHFPADVVGAMLITTPLILFVGFVVHFTMLKLLGIKC